MSLQKNNEERRTVSWKHFTRQCYNYIHFTICLLESWNDEKKDQKGSCGEKLYLPLSVVKNLCLCFDWLHLLEFFVIILPIWQCVFYMGHTRIGDFFVLVWCSPHWADLALLVKLIIYIHIQDMLELETIWLLIKSHLSGWLINLAQHLGDVVGTYKGSLPLKVKVDGLGILLGDGGDTWPLFCIIELFAQRGGGEQNTKIFACALACCRSFRNFWGNANCGSKSESVSKWLRDWATKPPSWNLHNIFFVLVWCSPDWADLELLVRWIVYIHISKVNMCTNNRQLAISSVNKV